MADLPLGGVTVEIKATIDVLERDLAKARAAVHGFDQEAAQSAKRAETSAQKVGREAAAAAQKATQANTGTAKAVEKVTEASKASGTQATRTADVQVAAARRAADAQIAEQRRVAAHQAAIARGDLVKQVNPVNGVVSYVPRMPAKGSPGVRALGGTADEARKVAANLDLESKSATKAAAALGFYASAGVVAAAATGALAIAYQQVAEASKWADGIDKTSTSLGVNVEKLQELQFAATRSGVSVAALEGNLAGLNAKLGAMKAGLASLDEKKAFAALGFKPDDLKRFNSVADLLPEIADRIQLVGDAAQQADIAKALGLEATLPLLRKGSEGLNALIAEARSYGLVLDAELIRKGSEANRQLELTGQIINLQLKGAFLSLAPTVSAAALEVSKLVLWLAEAIKRTQEFQLVSRMEGGPNGPAGIGYGAGASARRWITGQGNPDWSKFASPDRSFDANGSAGMTPADLARMRRSAFAGIGKKAGRTRSPPRDTNLERTEQVNSELASSSRAMLRAMLALTVNVEDRADLEKKILDQEAKIETARLNKLVADIADDKGLSAAKKKSLTAELQKVKVAQAEIDLRRKALIDHETQDALARENLALRQAEQDGQIEMLQLEDGLARTAGARREIELKLLDLADQRLAIELEAIEASGAATEAEKEIARAKLKTLKATRGAREEGVMRKTQDPLEAFFDGLPRTTDEVNEAFQRMEAEGLSSLIDGLAAASVGAADLGDVFRNVLMQMAMDANRILLQSLLSGAAGGMSGGGKGQQAISFFSKLLGAGGGGGGGLTADLAAAAAANPMLFAEGGLFRGQGGPTSDANLARISDGEFITNAEATRKHLPLLTAINDDKVPGFKKGGIFGFGALGAIGEKVGFGGVASILLDKFGGGDKGPVESTFDMPGRARDVLRNGRPTGAVPLAPPSLFLPAMSGNLLGDNDDAPGRGNSSRITTGRGTGGAVVQHIVNNYSHAIPDRDARRTSAQSAGAAATKTALAARRGIAS